MRIIDLVKYHIEKLLSAGQLTRLNYVDKYEELILYYDNKGKLMYVEEYDEDNVLFITQYDTKTSLKICEFCEDGVDISIYTYIDNKAYEKFSDGRELVYDLDDELELITLKVPRQYKSAIRRDRSAKNK